MSAEHLKQVRNVAADKGYYKRRSMIEMEQLHDLRMLVPPTHQDRKEKQRYAPDHPPEIEKRYKDKLMRRLKTPQGRAVYKKRNTVVEGGFANIKNAIGLHCFRMKGLEGVGIEWLLGSIAYNCRKITSMAKRGSTLPSPNDSKKPIGTRFSDDDLRNQLQVTSFGKNTTDYVTTLNWTYTCKTSQARTSQKGIRVNLPVRIVCRSSDPAISNKSDDPHGAKDPISQMHGDDLF